MSFEAPTLTGIYAQADKYLEPLLCEAFDKSRMAEPSSDVHELTNILIHLARLNQYEGQVANSPSHGKFAELARLIGTDFLTVHLDQDNDGTIRIRLFDAIHRHDILRATFIKSNEYDSFNRESLVFY